MRLTVKPTFEVLGVPAVGRCKVSVDSECTLVQLKTILLEQLEWKDILNTDDFVLSLNKHVSRESPSSGYQGCCAWLGGTGARRRITDGIGYLQW